MTKKTSTSDSNSGQPVALSPSMINSMIAQMLPGQDAQAPAYVAFIYPVSAAGKGVVTIPVQPPVAKKHRRPQPKAAECHHPLNVTFQRKGGLMKEHFLLLLNMLEHCGWVMSETRTDDFLDLFSGANSDCRVIWNPQTGKGILRDLIRRMIENGFIACPEGHRYIQIIESHFVYPDGQFVHGLKGGYTSQKASSVINKCMEILAINPKMGDYQPTRMSSKADLRNSSIEDEDSETIREMFSDERYDGFES